ncbi:PREDICTED: T-cell surface antigen CD2-like isoform X1 [Calidris pugnax]|uniref:T-cell surface antigen CD2-like isoform X1 n=1 Tax=Calidris pugnax TaxID=198806 RepID=UPI00071D9C1A|nr:PREDICTED: T-cell surface antigen CD2-like isoform X1 [Calidris pugnax]
MDFSSPFTLQCLLVIITVTHGSVTSISVLRGGSAVFSVGIQSLQSLSRMTKENGKCFTAVVNDTLLAKCGNSAGRCLNLENGSLVLRSVEKEDEGTYEFVFHNTTRVITLEVFEPVIGIQCFPNGTGELSCDVTSNESTSFRWLLNGAALSAPEACVKDGGKKVLLDKTVPGEFVCEVSHGNSNVRTRPVVLSCSYGDLLQYPWFIYILAGCAGGAVILVVVVSSLICCCMKRKHKFLPVPSEEEKDDGLIMSVVSSEGVKSPPNGDHVEAQAAQIDCPPKPDAARTGQGVEPQPLVEENLPVEINPEELPDPEVIVDVENQENASDCFPDPTDD